MREYFNFLLPHNSLNFTIILTKILFELVAEVVGSLASFVDQLKRFIRIRIWSIWTARQPASVGIGYQDDIPLADANDEAEVDADATNRQ